MQFSWFRIQMDLSCACLDLHGVSDTGTRMMGEDRQPLKKELEKGNLREVSYKFGLWVSQTCTDAPKFLSPPVCSASATLLLEEIASWRHTWNFLQQVVATIAAKKN
jgi:hypothetical protein